MLDGPQSSLLSSSRQISRLQRLRFVLWGIVALALMLGGIVAAGAWFRAEQQVGGAEIGIDGPFRLTTHDGRSVTEADFKGKVTAWFFGFTNCPDVCPTTLTEFTNLLRDLGPKAGEFTPVLVTVDPERDTQPVLGEYMEAFDPRIVALTGAQEQVDVVVKGLQGYYRKQPLDGGGYSMDHTATVYLLDSTGRFEGTLDFHEDSKTRLAKVERLLSKRG